MKECILLATDIDKVIEPKPINDRVNKDDVAPIITTLSTDSSIVFKLL